MKQIHTKSKKANRSSAWDKGPSFRSSSALRKNKRMALQPHVFKTFGLQIIRSQAIRIDTHIKTIYHAA